MKNNKHKLKKLRKRLRSWFIFSLKERRDTADRLSDLPESLQLHILSFLDARDAVQTMTLSKSWVSKWASTPVLNFSSRGFRNVDDFDKFVVDALSRRQPVKLDRITFKHDGDYRPKSLEKVFDYAFSHGVKELEANILDINSWPIGLHTSSDSLTSLTLSTKLPFGCLFYKPRSGSFKNVTNLHLKWAIITDSDLFSGFPELNKLRLEFCRLVTEGYALNVHAPKLSELTISCYNCHVNRCEFTTPKLRYFEWQGFNFPRLVTHDDGFPILDTVVIDYYGYNEKARKMVDDLLMWFNTLHNARSLTLFSRVINLLTLFPVNGCSPFRDLKCLKLDLRIYPKIFISQGPCRPLMELLELVPGLKAYLLPESHDAKCCVMVIDSLRPQAIAILQGACVVN